MPRFVILEHDHPALHWDLMLEAGDVLRTWRLAAPPMNSHAIEATALGDHRHMYLDYEGPVSGNRGSVRRWDAGAFDGDLNLLHFHGMRIQGTWCLELVEGTQWRFAPAQDLL